MEKGLPAFKKIPCLQANIGGSNPQAPADFAVVVNPTPVPRPRRLYIGGLIYGCFNYIISDTLCNAKGVSIKKLLEQTNINRNFIYDLEKGGKVPSADRLERIADYLDCSVDYLLGRADNPEVNKKCPKWA